MKSLIYVCFCSAMAVTLLPDPALAAAYDSAVLADSPELYWRLDETSASATIVNSGTSGSTYDGTATSSLDLTQAGPAFSGFDPANTGQYSTDTYTNREYVAVADPGVGSNLDFGAGDTITMELWIKQDPTGSADSNLLSKGRLGTTDTDQNWSFLLKQGSGSPSLGFRTADDTTWVRYRPLMYSYLNDTRWHHLVMSHTFGDGTAGSSSTVSYIDGTEIPSSMARWYRTPDGGSTVYDPTVADEAPIQSNSDMWIGATLNFSQYNGVIDEVAVYRSSLTAAQVASHYQASGSPIVDPVCIEATNDVYNGDFEIIETHDIITGERDGIATGWTDVLPTAPADYIKDHVGLQTTGLKPGTHAALMNTEYSPSGGSVLQGVATGSQWEVEFLAAALEPDSGDRTLTTFITHEAGVSTGGDQINFRVIEGGILQVYNNTGGPSGWQTLGSGFQFSTDADSDGLLESVSDTVNVHTIKFVGDYSEDPWYSVYLSDANSDEMNLVAERVQFFQNGVPVPGDEVGVRSISFAPRYSQANYVVDNVTVSSVISLIPGDANEDGSVDVSDLGILATNYGTIGGMAWGDGDFTDDGNVDVSDLGILATNYGATSASAVPEPSTLSLLVLCVLALAWRRPEKP